MAKEQLLAAPDIDADHEEIVFALSDLGQDGVLGRTADSDGSRDGKPLAFAELSDVFKKLASRPEMLIGAWGNVRRGGRRHTKSGYVAATTLCYCDSKSKKS